MTRCANKVMKERKLRAEAISHSKNKLIHMRKALNQKNEIVERINVESRKVKDILKMTIRKERSYRKKAEMLGNIRLIK